LSKLWQEIQKSVVRDQALDRSAAFHCVPYQHGRSFVGIRRSSRRFDCNVLFAIPDRVALEPYVKLRRWKPFSTQHNSMNSIAIIDFFEWISIQ
jgi:hypothetical protein